MGSLHPDTDYISTQITGPCGERKGWEAVMEVNEIDSPVGIN